MREHKIVTTIDPIFAEATELLFGGAVDPQELWDVVSKQDDGSEFHVRSASKPKRTKAERQRLEARIGLGSNMVGMVAGAAALKNSLTSHALDKPSYETAGKGVKAFINRKPGKYLSGASLTPKGKRLVRGAAIAGASLQTANVVGDVVANRVLAREAKIKKAFDNIVGARRAGALTTEQAVARVEAIEKKFFGKPYFLRPLPSRAGSKEFLAGMTKDGKLERQIRNAQIDRVNAKNRPKAIRAAMIGTGAISAGAAGTAGYKRGKQKGSVALSVPESSKPLKAAPKKEVVKSEQFTTTWTGEISKVDEDKRQVFGWCSLSELDGKPVVDLQGDYVPIDEIEKSAYTYVLSSRKGGDMHARDGESPLHTADMIESFVVTPEKLEQMGLPKDSLPLGWWVGFKVNDDKQWELVKKRERTGFSIHGKGSRTSKMLEE